MIKYLKDHQGLVNELLDSNKNKTEWKVLQDYHRIQIEFLQHERLIHLLVTLTIGILFFIGMCFTLVFQAYWILGADLLLLVLLVPYIWHYFQLENGVQDLYKLDQKIELKTK